MRSALKPPETTICTSRMAGVVERVAHELDQLGVDARAARRRRAGAAATRSASVSEVSSRTPHRSSPSASATSSAVRTESLSKSTSTVTFISRAEARRRTRARRRRCRRRRPRSARAGRCRRRGRPTTTPARRSRRRSRPPTCAAQPSPVCTSQWSWRAGKYRIGLPRGGLDDLAHVAHDQRAARHAAEVDRLEVGEQRVVALDRHHGLPRARSRRPRAARCTSSCSQPSSHEPSGRAAAGALLEHRDRLVDPAEDRLLALEDLHQHPRVAAVRPPAVAFA